MHRRETRGFVLLEGIVSLALITGVAILLVYATTEVTQHGDALLTRQRAMMAAESALNEIRDGCPPAASDFAERFDGMKLEWESKPGTGDWDGFSLVTVTVTARDMVGSHVSVRLAGYTEGGAS